MEESSLSAYPHQLRPILLGHDVRQFHPRRTLRDVSVPKRIEEPPQRLAPQRTVQVALGQVQPARRSPVAARQRAQRLQPARHCRGEALLAAQHRHAELVGGRGDLVAAVGPPQLLNCLVGAPGQL